MRNIYTVNQCYLNQNEWYCTVEEPLEINQLQPTGQVLTDSDNLAFVYLVVENDEYSYIQFPKNIWPTLLEIVQNKQKIVLQCGNEKMELIDFVNELEMLLFNIEGNGNYGDVFVHTVETIFEPIFKKE